MATEKSLTIAQMTRRICEREDNTYSKKVVSDVLKAYMEECKKGLIKGERVQLAGIGTIIPEVKIHRSCSLPTWNNNNHENTPYTRMRMSRNYSLIQKMNRTLLKNIQNGILGLEELPFSKQQIDILRNSGLIPNEDNE